MRWSYSSHRVMRRCQRQYAFGQIVAWHNTKDPFRKEVFILKQLQSLAMWQGSLVHKVLSTQLPLAIKQGKPIDASKLQVDAEDLMSRQLEFSAARRYRDEKQTKMAAGDNYCALIEHERGESISPDRIQQVRSNLRQCFEALAGEEWFVTMVQSGSSHRYEHRASFAMDDARISATLDLIFEGDDGCPRIVDWKVAKSETSNYSWQLLIYALVLLESGQWSEIHPENIRLYEANLLRGEFRQHHVDGQRLDQAEDFVYKSVTEMNALRGAGGYAELNLDEFEVARRPGTCALCSYSEVCIRSLEEAGRHAEAEVVQGRLL